MKLLFRVFSLTLAMGLVACGAGAGSTDVSDLSPPTLGTPVLIENDDVGYAVTPALAADSSGNAVAVWSHFEGLHLGIRANRYVAGVGWGTAQRIDGNISGDAQQPQVAVDASGNAVAIWVVGFGTSSEIWVNRYSAGSGWGTASKLSGNGKFSDDPVVASDASGNAIAVWTETDAGGAGNYVWSNRHTVGLGWGTAQQIATGSGNFGSTPSVSVDASGNAFAIWRRSDGIRGNIWVNRYTVGVGWGTEEQIEASDAETVSFPPRIAFDSSGNAMAVWSQQDSGQYSIWSNRYTAGVGWGSPQLVESENTSAARYPDIVFDSSGNAIVVWERSSGMQRSIWTNRYILGIGWEVAHSLASEASMSTGMLAKLDADSNGNVLVVWNQPYRSVNSVWAIRYAPGSGWGSASLLEPNIAGAAWFSGGVAFGTNGQAIVVWHQYDGARADIWGSIVEFN